MLEVSNWNSFDKIRLGSLLPLFKGHDSKCKIKKLIYYFFMFSWNRFHSDLNFYRDLNQATHLSRKLFFAADWRSTEQGTKSHLCFILHSCAGSSVTDASRISEAPGHDPDPIPDDDGFLGGVGQVQFELALPVALMMLLLKVLRVLVSLGYHV